MQEQDKEGDVEQQTSRGVGNPVGEGRCPAYGESRAEAQPVE